MINNILRKAGANEAIRHSFILTAGTVVAQLIPLLFMLLLTRFYTNESFGINQLFYQITVVLGVVANGRLEQPVLAVKEEDESVGLFQTAVKLSVYICCICLILFTIFALVFPANKIVVGLGKWLWVLPVSIFMSAHSLLLSNRLNRFKKYRTMVTGKVILVFFTSIVPAAGILFHINHTALMLIMGLIAGQTISVWYYRLKAGSYLPGSLWFTAAERNHLHQQRSFTLYSAPAILIDQLAAALPILFIAMWYGSASTGDMGFAQRILIVPSVFIASSVSQVFFKQASDYYHSGKNLFSFTIKTFGILLLIGIIPYVIIILFGNQLLPWLFGQQWLHASYMAQVLVWAMILKFAVSPVSVVMVITNRIKLQALWQIIALLLNLLLALIAWKWLTLMQYIIALTIMDVVLYLLYLYFILYSTKKKDSLICVA